MVKDCPDINLEREERALRMILADGIGRQANAQKDLDEAWAALVAIAGYTPEDRRAGKPLPIIGRRI